MSHFRKDYYTKAIPPCKNLVPYEIGEFLKVKCGTKNENTLFGRKLKFETRFCVIKNEIFYIFKDEDGKSEDQETKCVDLRTVYDLNLIQKFERNTLPKESMNVIYIDKICVLKLRYGRKTNSAKILKIILDTDVNSCLWISITFKIFEKDNYLNERYFWCRKQGEEELDNPTDHSNEFEDKRTIYQCKHEPWLSKLNEEFKSWLEHRGNISTTYQKNLEKCSELLLKIVRNHETESKCVEPAVIELKSLAVQAINESDMSAKRENSEGIKKNFKPYPDHFKNINQSTDVSEKERKIAKVKFASKLNSDSFSSFRRPPEFVKKMQTFFDSKVLETKNSPMSTVTDPKRDWLPYARWPPTSTTTTKPISTQAKASCNCKTVSRL